MSFTHVPNSGPFNDDRKDGMRAAALMALAELDLQLPGPVIDYFKMVERELITATFDRRRDFLETSWDQFRGQP